MADKEPGLFLLVNIAAQRARQLMQGAPPMINTQSRKPAAIAISEVEQELVPYAQPGDLLFDEAQEDPEEGTFADEATEDL